MFVARIRVLELETKVLQLKNDMKALQAAWDTERLQLADLKEQAIRTTKRLQQQNRREPKEPNGEPEEKKISPAAANLLYGGVRGVLPG